MVHLLTLVFFKPNIEDEILVRVIILSGITKDLNLHTQQILTEWTGCDTILVIISAPPHS